MPVSRPTFPNRFSGGKVALVNGLISDCGRLVRQGCERYGWFDMSTLKEPFRIEGKKIMGYELAFDLADAVGSRDLKLPDVIVYPTGGGTGLIGMWKAFDEMQQLGWIGPERPRMVVVQAAGCAPVVRAFDLGAEYAELFPNAATVAAGLRVPAAIGDFLILQAVRESRGIAITVDDHELLDGVRELTSLQGSGLSGSRRVKDSVSSVGVAETFGNDRLVCTGRLKYTHLFHRTV
jgi:threonine synthase